MKSGKLLSRYGHGRKDTLAGNASSTNFYLFREVHAPIEKDKRKGIEYVIVVKVGLLVPVYTYAYTAHKEEKNGILFLVPDKGVKNKKRRSVIEYSDIHFLGD